jgi:Nitrile hydratase, alpha chain
MSEQTPQKTRRDVETHIIAQAWKDETYKQELLSNPKAVFEREFGVQMPAEANVRVLEENSTNLYFVLPKRPNLSGADLSDEQLEAIAGGSTPVCISLATGAGAAALTLGANITADLF